MDFQDKERAYIFRPEAQIGNHLLFQYRDKEKHESA